MLDAIVQAGASRFIIYYYERARSASDFSRIMSDSTDPTERTDRPLFFSGLCLLNHTSDYEKVYAI